MAVYKDAIKSKLGAADFLEYESVAALLLEVVKQVSAERTVATVAPMVTAAGEGTAGGGALHQQFNGGHTILRGA